MLNKLRDKKYLRISFDSPTCVCVYMYIRANKSFGTKTADSHQTRQM